MTASKKGSQSDLKNRLDGTTTRVVALAGGVGGARLADGLAQTLPSHALTVIVNTGDDFEHLSLVICPDLDTVCYTLAGIANPVTGWGRSGETFNALETLADLGGANWFRVGDKDIGLHLERTMRKKAGQSLSQITQHICNSFGIPVTVLPMSDDPVPTWVYTKDGAMPFQEYFVRRQCQPQVTGFRFDGAERSKPAPGTLQAIQAADYVVICPSNPWVSIDPILSIPGIRSELQGKIVIAVSPIIGGQAVKGPAAKMYAEMGIQPSAFSVAKHYQSLLNGFILDHQDANLEKEISGLGLRTLVTNTLMKTSLDRRQLAGDAIRFAESIQD